MEMAKYPEKLRARDIIQIINSILFIGLGIFMAIRLMSKSVLLPVPILVCLSFIGFGVYRLNFIIGYFKNRREDQK